MSKQPYFFINNKECDFCKTTQEPLSKKLISYNFGFISCENCIKQSELEIINWIIANQKISWLYFFYAIKYPFNIEDTYTIERTNQNIENDWNINANGWIIYSKKYQDFLLPMVKYNQNHNFLFKKVTLNEFCKHNTKFNYKVCNNILSSFLKNL